MLREHRCSLHHAKGAPWHSVFNIKGAPLLVGGNHGESHLLLRDNSERLGFVWLESYSMDLSKERIITMEPYPQPIPKILKVVEPLKAYKLEAFPW
jgi:hypothetical protein